LYLWFFPIFNLNFAKPKTVFVTGLKIPLPKASLCYNLVLYPSMQKKGWGRQLGFFLEYSQGVLMNKKENKRVITMCLGLAKFCLCMHIEMTSIPSPPSPPFTSYFILLDPSLPGRGVVKLAQQLPINSRVEPSG
jgi:hypothetical protein